MFQIELPKDKTKVWDDFVPIIRSLDGRTTTVYLTDHIDAPCNYNELCFLLDTALEGDRVTLVINNGGGVAASAFMIIHSMKHSKATIHAKLSGTVASAATIITMYCDTIEVAAYTEFMCHNYNYGTSGSGAQVKEYVNFTDREFTAAAAEIYAGFLTPAELKSISTQDKEIWLNRNEVLRKWDIKKGAVAPTKEAVITAALQSEPKKRGRKPTKKEA